MKLQAKTKQPLAGTFLALAAIFLTSVILAQAAWALPVIVTLITTDESTCSAEFVNNNCGGLGDPGDICVEEKSNPMHPTKVKLRYILMGPGANNAEFVNMVVSLSDGNCPSDVQDDFPDFGTDCVHTPASPGNAMLLDDDNVNARTWNYWMTVKPGEDCSPVALHPIIENGGGNSSSDDDEDGGGQGGSEDPEAPKN